MGGSGWMWGRDLGAKHKLSRLRRPKKYKIQIVSTTMISRSILRIVANTTPAAGPSAPLTNSTGKSSPARESLGIGRAVDTQLEGTPTCKEGEPTCEGGWSNAQAEAVAGGWHDRLKTFATSCINSNAYLGKHTADMQH